MYFNAIRENKILAKISGFTLTAERYVGGRQTDSHSDYSANPKGRANQNKLVKITYSPVSQMLKLP